MYRLLKRTFDIAVAGFLLVMLSPFLLIIAVAIKCTSQGPAVFKQERAGQHGKSFVFYKFRTMTVEADPFGPSPKSEADTRLTTLGRFLRQHSVDELPQLVNIVIGDMSLVGPRPLYVSQIPEWNEQQRKRLLVKPGLTGLAQVSGRGELTREEKLGLDAKYVEAACLRLDCKIVWATISQVLGCRGIYEKRYSQASYTRGDAAEQDAKERNAGRR